MQLLYFTVFIFFFQMEFLCDFRGSKKKVKVEGEIELDQFIEIIKKTFYLENIDNKNIIPQRHDPDWDGELVDITEVPNEKCMIFVHVTDVGVQAKSSAEVTPEVANAATPHLDQEAANDLRRLFISLFIFFD